MSTVTEQTPAQERKTALKPLNKNMRIRFYKTVMILPVLISQVLTQRNSWLCYLCCRHELQHFVDNIQGYLSNQILNVSWAEFQHELEHNVSNQNYILDLKNLDKPECLTGGDRLLDLVEKSLEYWTCQEAPDIRS